MMKNKCWVVKIGSALLTNNGKGIDKQLIARWVEQIVDLQAQNIDIILVSSGSIVEGMKRLGWTEKPNDIHKPESNPFDQLQQLPVVYECHLVFLPTRDVSYLQQLIHSRPK